MSREIKFRAWDTENKVYLEPDEAFLIADKGLPGRFSQRFGYTADENLVIEQYTGLKDKNGKEIFEGDVVRQFDDEEYFVVKFEYGGFLPFTANMLTFDTDYCEVIGNIHENPELLGGEE